MSDPVKIYTIGQVARICKVAPRTISKWFDSGRLKGYLIPGSNDRRIPLDDLVKFMSEHGLPMPDELKAGPQDCESDAPDDSAILQYILQYHVRSDSPHMEGTMHYRFHGSIGRGQGVMDALRKAMEKREEEAEEYRQYFAEKERRRLSAKHEFDSSQTCNYCGKAAERCEPNERCYVRAMESEG